MCNNFTKRALDICISFVVLFLFSWLIIAAWIVAAVETKGNGFFIQKRIGRYGKPFNVIKIKTMHPDRTGLRSTISTNKMSGITCSGYWMRRYKIDELPQLINVLIGQMSLVGPRPDVPGYADSLQGQDRLILELRPGITGPASIKYKNEEEILAASTNAKEYNDNVIWPDKVKINLHYYYNKSLFLDIYYIFKTIKG